MAQKALVADDPVLLTAMQKLPNTSARIRALYAHGMKKADIVRYLNAHFRQPGRPHDFRYQHVHNVLAQSVGRGEPNSQVSGSEEEGQPKLPERLDVQVDGAGRVVIPAVFRAAMGIGEGDRLMASVVDGELSLISPRMAVRRAQKLVRELIPGDDSLVDALFEYRRQEAADEFGNG